MRSKSRNRSSPCITVVCSPKWPYLKLPNDHFAIRKVRGICCRRQNLVQFSYYIHPCTRVTLRCQLDDSTIELNYLRLRVLVFNSTATFTLNDPVWSGLGGFSIQNLKCMLYIKIQTQLANRQREERRHAAPRVAFSRVGLIFTHARVSLASLSLIEDKWGTTRSLLTSKMKAVPAFVLNPKQILLLQERFLLLLKRYVETSRVCNLIVSLGAMVFPWDFSDDFKRPVQKY